MDLSINLGYLRKCYGTTELRTFDETLSAAVNAGFRFYDYNPSYIGENLDHCAKCERELIEAAGAQVWQGHAFMNRYSALPPVQFRERYHRSFESAALLGAKYIVVHADEYRTTDHYDVKEIADFTYEYIAPELEFAKKFGMKVAIENVFEDCPKGCSYIDGKCRFTSRADELFELIERFNDPDVVCCWDFGHAAVSFGYDSMLGELKKLKKHLHCTHVHDNFDNHDRHQLPFTGKIDWSAHMKYLREIGYGTDNDDKLSLELVYFPQPDDVFPAWLAYAKAVGDSLIKLYEN